MKRTLIALAGVAMGCAASAGATEYEDAWGPSVGATLPPLAALDQNGDERDLASLAGDNGLVLFVVRSADW